MLFPTGKMTDFAIQSVAKSSTAFENGAGVGSAD